VCGDLKIARSHAQRLPCDHRRALQARMIRDRDNSCAFSKCIGVARALASDGPLPHGKWDAHETMIEMLSNRSNEGAFPLDFLDLFVHGRLIGRPLSTLT
jgi:hypothetical protein